MKISSYTSDCTLSLAHDGKLYTYYHVTPPIYRQVVAICRQDEPPTGKLFKLLKPFTRPDLYVDLKPELKLCPLTQGIYPTTPPEYRGSSGSAGFDLRSAQSGEIFPERVQPLPTALSVEIPRDHVGIIKPRSGLAQDAGVHVLGGVIDSDYRGELLVLLTLLADTYSKYFVSRGDKIAQLLILPCLTTASLCSTLSPTSRGASGFGSTGTS